VGCWFPSKEKPTEPGDKFRPCFVMGVNADFGSDPKVCVAYGTGQRTSSKSGKSCFAHEFELDAGESGNKLDEQTRFNCSTYVWLPYEDQWFCKDSKMGSSYGAVPLARTTEIRSVIATGRAKAEATSSAKAKPAVIYVKKTGVGETLSRSEVASPDSHPGNK
jgi:hypothetical protein